MSERLPIELLQLVFRHGDTPSACPETWRYANFPYTPLMVSKRWQQAALSCPDLWTTVLLIAAMPLSVLTAWLSRSGSLPLHVLIPYYPPQDIPVISQAMRLADLTFAHIGRWRRMEWACTSPLVANHIYPHLSRAITLRELRFSALSSSRWLDSRTQTLRSSNMPSLTRLDLEDLDIQTRPQLGSSSVTELSLIRCHLSVEYFKQLLQGMPDLRELHLEDNAFRVDWEEHQCIAEDALRNIRRLKMHYQYFEDPESSLLPRLLGEATSSLEHLSLRVDRVYVGRFQDPPPRVLLDISKAFDRLPSTLKAVEVVVGACTSMGFAEEMRKLEEKLRGRVQDLTSLESLVVQFGDEKR
jgi:hypothetical protein